jgi:hypothetical protein
MDRQGALTVRPSLARVIVSPMGGQRLDALLRQLAKMPPLSRAELVELARRDGREAY